MKKKYLSTLLLGLLVIGTTGTVTSCKDYDDDINGLETRLATVESALTQCKTDCENARNTLKSQLEAKDAELATAIAAAQSAAQQAATAAANAQSTADQAVKDAKAAAQAAADEVSRATAAEAVLEARINTLDKAIEEINKTLAGKVSQSDFDATVKDIYGKLEAVQTDLGTALTRISTAEGDIATLKQGLQDEETARIAAANNLQTQIDAIKLWETRIDKLEEQVKTFVTADELTTKLATLKADLEKEIEKLGVEDINGLEDALKAKANAADVYTKAEIEAKMQSLSEQIAKVQSEVDALTVFVQKSLRGLVFIPDAYYYGVEATKVKALDYWKFNIAETAWNKTEAKGYTDHARYDSVAASRMLTFVANYHMNPSSADISKFGKVTILTDDKEYIGSRAAASAPFAVKDYTAKDGDLQVSIDVANPEKIKNIPDNQAITVFAVQVNTNAAGSDTTITSDYATIYKESIKNLKIHHAAGNDVPWAYNAKENTHDASAAVANHKDHKVLMQTAHEASYDYATAQDTVNYNETLDLNKLVEVHYTTIDGKNKVLTAAEMTANGLSYKFELTGLYYGTNNTSESAHAAIQGSTFRPQMPAYDAEKVGIQQAYGATQDRQEIGRTPLVRVSLVDADGNVLDYGYIRIRISEKGKDTPVDADKYIDKTGDGWSYTYNGECVDPAKSWSYKTKWIETEYDLYNMLGLTRDEFESIYTAETYDEGDLVQYVLGADGKKFVKASTKYGVVYEHLDLAGQSSAQTQVLEWNISGAEMKKVFVDGGAKSLNVAIKYASNNSNYPNVFVRLNVGTPITITKNAPSATASIIPNQISNYWYTTNTAEAGTDEIHTNTLTPEDNANGNAYDLDNLFSDVFTGNNISAVKFVKDINDLTSGKEYAASKLTLDLVFDESNVGKEYKGYLNGVLKTYVISLSADGKTMYANIKGQTTKQVVATIEGDKVNQQKVVYAHNKDKNGYSESMLNYVAHNALADDAITAIIGLKAQNQCSKALPLADNTFNVRFLRPLNVFDSEKSIQDAANKLQTINVVDLVKFTDWRDLWNGTTTAGNSGNYYNYYGIESITLADVEEGNIAKNPLSVTNLGQSDKTKFVALNTVSNQVQFTVKDGVLTYTNLSSTVADFDVKVPVAVKYIWGTVYTDVTIHVKKTLNNAKRQ